MESMNTKCIAYLCLASFLFTVMQRNAFEINGSSVPHASLGRGPAHTREEIIPRVYSMSGSGDRTGYAALVMQNATRPFVSKNFDPKMESLAVVLR